MEINITLIPETGTWCLYMEADRARTVRRRFTVYADMLACMTEYANEVMQERVARLQRDVERKLRTLEYVQANIILPETETESEESVG